MRTTGAVFAVQVPRRVAELAKEIIFVCQGKCRNRVVFWAWESGKWMERKAVDY